MIAILVLLFLFLAGPTAQGPQTPYAEIVALQNRALQAKGIERELAHRESIEIAQTLGDAKLLAVLFQRLGRTLEPNRVQDAVIAYETALDVLKGEKNLNVQEELDRITSLPKGYSGRSNRAPVDLYSESLDRELMTAKEDPALLAQLLIDVGNAYFSQPQLALAMDRYTSVLEKKDTPPKLRAYALANSGEIFRIEGKIDEAERNLREALDLLRQSSDRTEARRALVMLAGIQRDRGRDAESRTTYDQALALYSQKKDALGEGRAYAGLGLLHLKAKRFTEAEGAYTRAIELGRQTDDNRSLWAAYWGLGQAQRATGDLPGAAKSLLASLDLIEGGQQNLTTDEGKVTLLDSVQDAFDELIKVYLDQTADSQDAGAKALSVAERARAGAMRDLMGGVSRRTLCPPAQASGRGASAGAQAAPGLPSPMAQRAPGIAAGQRGPGTALQPRDVPDPRCSDGRKMDKITPAPLARLVFHVLDDRTVIFATEQNGNVRVRVLPIGRDVLAKRVVAFRDALGVDSDGRGVDVLNDTGSPASDAYREPARSLYRDLIEPVAAAIPDGETLIIEPHGPLWLTPFAALEDETGRPLIDRWAIVYSPSAEILEEIRREPPFNLPGDLNALIVGNPTAPQQDLVADDRFRNRTVRAAFQPLPSAEKEAESIGALLPVSRRKLLIGPAATFATVQSEISTHTLIHLASHALANSRSPLDSFVMLAANNGIEEQLTARRVLGLSVNADLVTLSACQTGLGYLSGDGVIGLSRAFLARGARSVVVSQWSVSDVATAALMEGFYKRYINGAEDKARALQKAMNEVRSKADFRHPKYWAPFFLVGAER